MKGLNKYAYAIAIATVVWSCGGGEEPAADQQSTGQQQEQTEEASDHHAHGHKDDFQEMVRNLEDPERFAWQKPEDVIAGFPQLKGKTIADIGVGTGYFAFRMKDAGKVIAIDIDQRYLDFIENKKADGSGANIETRITTEDEPGLQAQEVDGALIVNTYHHISNRVEWLKKLKAGMKDGGALIIVEYNKTHVPFGPPSSMKLEPSEVEAELQAAGFNRTRIDSETLPYQYIVKAMWGDGPAQRR